MHSQNLKNQLFASPQRLIVELPFLDGPVLSVSVNVVFEMLRAMPRNSLEAEKLSCASKKTQAEIVTAS